MPDAAEPGSLFNIESHRGSPRPALVFDGRITYAPICWMCCVSNVSARHFPFHVQLIDMT